MRSAFGIWSLRVISSRGRVDRLLAVEAEAPAAGFQRAQAFLQRLLEGAADGHRLADGLHLRGQHRVGGREFLEGEARDLGHHVVDRRLEDAGVSRVMSLGISSSV